jgi:hypothetical protein
MTGIFPERKPLQSSRSMEITNGDVYSSSIRKRGEENFPEWRII